ncbi:MAG: SH3-like domain-containing protein [Candidatus Velthaea sp.]
MSFVVGERVRTSGRDPAHHYRVPRYLRAKRGRIEAVHAAYPLADARAAGDPQAPVETLYTVAFDGREVWDGDAEPNTVYHAELWESYLVAEAPAQT